MNSFFLLTAPGCHLCEHGRHVLDTLAGEGLLTWSEVEPNSEQGPELAAVAPPLRPVMFERNRRIVGCGRLSARRLRRSLAASA
jgi:hypothetical protein